MKNLYAGIGSRQTPPDILKIMEATGEFLGKKGWTLRSGGAEGADAAFEKGCDNVKGKKEIFLPWEKYNNHSSNLFYNSDEISKDIKFASFDLAANYHPAWHQCSYGAKCLLARDGFQILGKDLKTPVSLVIFWSPSLKKGGTTQALRIAQDYKIPIVNLGNSAERAEIINKHDLGIDFLEEASFNLFSNE